MQRSKCLHLLDGGMASQLVENGRTAIDTDPLWSSRLLFPPCSSVEAGGKLFINNESADTAGVEEEDGSTKLAIDSKDDPVLSPIAAAHRDFIEAGADIIETNTYQVSLEGFQEYLGLSADETLNLIRQSVTHHARPEVHRWQRLTGKTVRIAGAIGPYGAAKHDGSEYNGDYVDQMTVKELKDWHRPRMKALAEVGVDVFAFETIPAEKEGAALVELLVEEFPLATAWLSFSCKDGLHTNHGELLGEAVLPGVNCNQVTHVGVNCTNPEYMSSLLDSLQIHSKDLIVYPNSGETWTSGVGWAGDNKLCKIEEFITMCRMKGATIIGGCCRVTQDVITKMRAVIDKN